MQFQNKRYVKSMLTGRWEPAQEAPVDLTATTNDMMRNASNTRNRNNQEFDPGRTSEETQREDGGNVQENPNSMSDDVDAINPENAPGGEDPNAMADDGMGGEDDGMGDMGGMDDGMGDMGGEDFGGGSDMGGEELPEETPEQAQAIMKLHMGLKQFYDVISNTLEALSDYAAPSSTPELQKLFSSCMVHLTGIKDVLVDLLTTDFLPTNYAYKLRKYVALRHVYSTVLEILDLHFQILKDEIDHKNIVIS